MEWYQALIAFAVAFIVAYAMVPVSKFIGIKIGAVDYPSNRRINKAPVPRTGGIAIYTGMLAGCIAIFMGETFCGWTLRNLYVLQGINYYVLYWGITAMFAVGLVDDIIQLAALPKFIGQLAAAVVIALSGVSIDVVRAVSGDYISLNWLDVPLTVLYIVIFVNITNLIDGLDGLAAGIAIIVTASLAVLVYMRGNFTLVLASLALIGACLAFLRFNFYPASVFMGDGGSHLLGALMAVLAIGGVVRTQGIVAMIVPLVIAGVPVLDTFSSIVRRRRAGVSVGKADMGHLHHRLMRVGLGQVRSVLVLWACSLALAVVGIFIGRVPGVWHWAIIVVLACVMFIIIQRLGLLNPVLRHRYESKVENGPRVRQVKAREREEREGATASGEGVAAAAASVAHASASHSEGGDAQ